MEHAANGALAASGPNVYVAYSVLSGILDGWDPAAPRVPRVAINTNYGAGDAWLTPVANFIQTRIDRPAVAAAGAWAYMVFTDADTGEIYVATNLGASTEGSGWGGSGTVGMTTRLADDADEGYSGMPVIAAIGNKVMVAWIAGPSGGIRAVVSNDNGVTWSTETSISTAQAWDLAAAGDGTRMGLDLGQQHGDQAQALHEQRLADDTNGHHLQLGRDVQGGLWAGRRAHRERPRRRGLVGLHPIGLLGGSTKGVNLRWRESSDNGASWKSTVTLATYSASSSKRFNDYPSVVMTSTPRRYVLYNTASSSFSTYKTVLEVGSGTP